MCKKQVMDWLTKLNFSVDDDNNGDPKFAFSINNGGSNVCLLIPKEELTKDATVLGKVGHVITYYIQTVDRK